MTDTPVLSYEEVQRDIAVLQLSGANFIRGSHYPQDQRFLDLCDVRGFLVWEEVLSWQPTVGDFSDGIFMLQSLRMADELVTASVNHPSVVIFAFFNEGDSGDGSPATSAAYGSMASRLRARSGGTRLITWGSNAAMNDRHLAYADICAFHDYTAWYPTTQPASFEEVHQILVVWEAYGRWVEEAYPDKPLLISEAGAGGLFRRKGPSEEKWTEEYQSLVMQMHLLAALQNARVAGIALWQFADVPIDQNTSTEPSRPSGQPRFRIALVSGVLFPLADVVSDGAMIRTMLGIGMTAGLTIIFMVVPATVCWAMMYIMGKAEWFEIWSYISQVHLVLVARSSWRTELNAFGLFWAAVCEVMLEGFANTLLQAYAIMIAPETFASAPPPLSLPVSTEAERPRGLNNKGLLGLNRQPKIAFQVGRIPPELDAEKRAGSISGQFERLWSRA